MEHGSRADKNIDSLYVISSNMEHGPWRKRNGHKIQLIEMWPWHASAYFINGSSTSRKVWPKFFFFENISGDAEAIPIISAPLRDGRTYSIWVGSECNVRVWPLRTRFSFGVTERVFYEICGPRNLGTLSWCKNKVGSRSERFPWYIAFALPRGSARLCQWTRGFRYMVM